MRSRREYAVPFLLGLLVLLTLGAGGINSLFRFSEWETGYNAADAVWVRDAANGRDGHWTNSLSVVNVRSTDGSIVLTSSENYEWGFQAFGNNAYFNFTNNAGMLFLLSFVNAPPTWQFGAMDIYAQSITTTNRVRFLPTTIAGAGNGNTNYTLLAGRDMFMGSSNVSITAAMDYTAGVIDYSTVTITNLSAISWGIGFSSVTNRWRFSGTYGTNAPNVLTNNTALELRIMHNETNATVTYNYFRPGL